jgi:hypothetical protein
MIEAFEQLWQGLLDITALFVLPDWGVVVSLLPVFLVVFVLGPLLSLLVLVWLVYVVIKPRTRVHYEEGPQRAQLTSGGEPIFPSAEPYCPRDNLVYPFAARTCDACGEDLSIRCPKCEAVRPAYRADCPSCGLVLDMAPRARTIAPARPRSGDNVFA